MESSRSQPDPSSPDSNATGTKIQQSEFIHTFQHRRFTEFCEACRRYRYIGLCYGTPGVGKTLSARQFSQVEVVATHDPSRHGPLYGLPLATAFYTITVINSPARVASGIQQVRDRLVTLAQSPIRQQAAIALGTIQLRNENFRRTHPEHEATRYPDEIPLRPTYHEAFTEWAAKAKALGDPTTLIVIDEADRLRTDSLEQVRSLFDEGGFGVVLIGMPGLEKRMARYPQLYSRIGFVHEFQPLAAPEMRRLLERHWAPVGVTLPDQPLAEEAASAILRITGGNFRLFNRLLSQIQRVLEINGLRTISKEAVEAAREGLVIGSS
jgi:DNA transposition AAA+ family ATPase